MEDSPQLAAVDNLFGKRDGGDAPIVVPDHIGDARLLDGGQHPFPLGHVHRQRLFAENCLAMLGSFNRNLGMEIVGRTDIDGINIVGRDELAPVALNALVAPAIGKDLSFCSIAGGNCLQHRCVVEIEEIADTFVAVGVGSAHKSIADHADAKRLCHAGVLLKIRMSVSRRCCASHAHREHRSWF